MPELWTLGVIATRFDFMGYIEEVAKISGLQFLLALSAFAGAVCPGLLAIWYFAPQMLHDCSSFVLILLSIAIALPLIMVNVIAMIGTIAHKHKGASVAPSELSLACLFSIGFSCCFSMLAIAAPLLVAFMDDFSLRTFVWSVLGSEVPALALSIFAGRSTTMNDSSS